MVSSAFLLIALSVPLVSAIDQGPITIEIDEEAIKLHVVAFTKKGRYFNTKDRAVTLKWGGEIRGFLAKHATEAMPWENYFNFTLLNKELSYDVDLSSVGCSCNAALFFVSLPGFNADGTIARGNENPWYCDANQMGGVWCWEHDTIESNMYAMTTTPHTCSQGPGQYIDTCDRIGCSTNTFRVDPKGLCPGDDCVIDTRRPFRVQQRYETDSQGKLVRIANVLSQEGNEFPWTSCGNPDYLERMTLALRSNMAMTFQLWGETHETMSWLDGMTGCTGTCVAEETEVTFSNIAIRSLSSQGSLSSPDDVLVV